jgi:hypothetical protein
MNDISNDSWRYREQHARTNGGRRKSDTEIGDVIDQDGDDGSPPANEGDNMSGRVKKDTQ